MYKKSYRDLKIPKMACSKLVKLFPPFFILNTRKICDYKEIFFLFYIAKSISFEDISVLKIRTFAAKLVIL